MRTKVRHFRLNERVIYAVVGWVSGIALGFLLYLTWRPYEIFLTFFPFVGMASALLYGDRRGKIPTSDEINRPIELFPKDTSSKRR
jgi:hypothetical protein